MGSTSVNKPYCVHGGDPAGPVSIGEYPTFDDALKARDEELERVHARGGRLVLTICNLDSCDYATDTGWDDGLTEEERERL